jgi:hypothetical protein
MSSRMCVFLAVILFMLPLSSTVRIFDDYHVVFYSYACFHFSNEINNDLNSDRPNLYPNVLVVNASSSQGKLHLRREVLNFSTSKQARSLTLVPILSEGMLRHKGRGATHIYHSWESFWPAVKLYKQIFEHVKYMVLPNDYVDNSFVSVAVGQLAKEHLSFYIVGTNTDMCSEDVLVIENSAWLKDDLAPLARKVYMDACELHVTHSHAPSDVLLSRRTSFGRPKILTNIVDLKDELSKSNLSFEYFIPHAEVDYCLTLKKIARPYKVHVTLTGDNMCNYIVAHNTSTIIEVLVRGLYATMYCELQKSIGVKVYGFMQKVARILTNMTL